jgi:PhnB protein
MTFNTYLQFDGNCEEALKFYEKALGGKLTFLMRYGESPEADKCSPESLQRVMHGRIEVGENVIMASDCPPQFYKKPAGFSISINVETPEEAERYYHALADKATYIHMPLGETFWARSFGMLDDRFGVSWMVNCEKKM